MIAGRRIRPTQSPSLLELPSPHPPRSLIVASGVGLLSQSATTDIACVSQNLVSLGQRMPRHNLSWKLKSEVREGEMKMRLLLLCLSLIIVIASNASARSLQEQALCAKQAETTYQAYNNAGSVLGFKVESSWHQSHYNKKLNKCLILVDQMYQYNGETSITAQLLDAFERRVLAISRPSLIMVAKKWRTSGCSRRPSLIAVASGRRSPLCMYRLITRARAVIGLRSAARVRLQHPKGSRQRFCWRVCVCACSITMAHLALMGGTARIIPRDAA